MRRRIRTLLCGVTLIALASLFLSYGKLVRSVEIAAGSAGLMDGEGSLR